MVAVHCRLAHCDRPGLLGVSTDTPDAILRRQVTGVWLVVEQRCWCVTVNREQASFYYYPRVHLARKVGLEQGLPTLGIKLSNSTQACKASWAAICEVCSMLCVGMYQGMYQATFGLCCSPFKASATRKTRKTARMLGVVAPSMVYL